MFSEGTDVVIATNQEEGLLVFSADHDTLALPLSSETELKSGFFEDYYSNADIRVTERSYGLKTQGSELGLCGHHPLPGKYPCLRKWDDAVGMAVNARGQLQIEWKIDDAKGSCLLKRIK